MPVKEYAATAIQPLAIRYNQARPASQGGNTLPGQERVAQRSSRASTATTRPAPKQPEPQTGPGVQQPARRRASQSAAHTNADTQLSYKDLKPVQRRPRLEDEEIFDYTEYFEAADNPYAAQTERLDAPQKPQRRYQTYHWLFYVGMGMLVTLLGWWLLIAAWTVVATQVGDRWNYGPAHVMTLSAIVGHNHDSQDMQSRFLAFEQGGRVEIIELPAGDATKAKIYVSQPLTSVKDWQGDPNAAVVNLSTTDVNHDGKGDLIVEVQEPAFAWNFQRRTCTLTLINTGTGFTPEGGQ